VRDPGAYCPAAEELNNKQRKAFVLIADMLSKSSLAEKSHPSDTEEINQFVKKEREKLFKSLEIWMTRPSSVPPPPQPPDAPLPWSILEEALRYLHQTLLDNMSVLTHKLNDKGVTCTMTYTLAEIVEALVVPNPNKRASD